VYTLIVISHARLVHARLVHVGKNLAFCKLLEPRRVDDDVGIVCSNVIDTWPARDPPHFDGNPFMARATMACRVQLASNLHLNPVNLLYPTSWPVISAGTRQGILSAFSDGHIQCYEHYVMLATENLNSTILDMACRFEPPTMSANELVSFLTSS
jgi:hypothetical protein